MQIAPATHFTSVPRGLAWIEIDAALGATLWLQGMQKGALRDHDGHEVVCVHLIAKAGARPAPRYVKRWKGANGKWRYAYASHEGGGIHNAAHFTEGARFAHGNGHYEIGADGTATHSHTGHQIGVGELGAHLEAHHGADIAAHKKGVLDRFIEQIGEASTPKHKAALEKKAAAYGYTKPKAEPAAAEKPASGPTKVAQKDGSTKVDRLTDDEYADTHDELSRLAQELNPGGLQQGPKGSARDALVAKINAARAKIGLKPHSDDPYADRSGEQSARQRAMGIRERQRAAKADAKAKPADPSEADMFSGGAWGKTDGPKAEPIAQKKDDAQGPDRMEHSPKSSHIKHVEWIADNPKSNKGTLRVHFKTGHVHDHYDRHRDDFTGMKDAASAGEFYNDRVRGIGESKAVREASPQQKKEARIEANDKQRTASETKRQSAVANYMAKNDPDSVVKTERGPFPKGEEAKPPAAKPAPEIAAKPAPSPMSHEDHYAAAQSTYGLSDRDMQIVKRRSQDAVKGHTQADAHDQAKAAVRDAVHRHIFQDRNMSPSQATKWMKEREAKAVTPVTKGLSAILKALATPWVEIPEDLALALVAKGKSHKYIKKVATGKTSKTGKPVFRYYYKVAADTHAAKHFHTGSAFADGKHGGHWHIHAKDGNKLHLKHDETGEERHMTTGELSAMLHLTHNVGAVEEAQRAKAKAEVAAAKESGSAKHVEAAKKRAEAVGVKEQAPEPAQTESVASEPVTTRHTFMDDPGDDKHAPGSIYRNGKGGKVYVSLAMKSRKGNRSDEDHGNYVPSGKVENTVTAREATPEEVARYEEWAAGPAGRAPRPKANIHAPQATPSAANIAAHMPAIKALRDQIVAINTMPQFSMERADANHAITAAAKALAEEMGNTPEAAHVAATVDALKSHISGTTNADVSRLDAILAGRAPDAPVPAQEPESPHGKQVQSASGASKVVLSGKTFEAKDEIRKMGGRWDAANKVWVLPVKDTMRGRADLSADLHHLRKRGVSHTFHKGRSLDAFIAALARTH